MHTDVAAEPFDAKYYAANGQDQDRVALWFYARIARRLLPAGGAALDIGAGSGFFCRRLSAFAGDVSALDVSPTARERIAQTSPSTLVHDDPAQVPDGVFDLVSALHVLEHLPEPGAMLRSIHGWLRPGGCCLVVVPDPDGWGHRLKADNWFAFRDPTHCSLLSRREWLDQISEAGLRLERLATDGLWDAPYVSRLPRVVQRPLFGAPAAVQVLAGRLVLPAGTGECVVAVARKPSA